MTGEASPVSLFFQMIVDASPGLVRNEIVLSTVVKLLEEKQRRLLFSLVLNRIGKERVVEPPEELLVLGVIRENNGYYLMDEEIKNSLLKTYTGREKEEALLETNETHVPSDTAIYNTLIFKIISGRTEGNTAVRQLMEKEGLVGAGGLTHRGFNFLLSSKKNQLWSLILAHLRDTRDGEDVLALCEVLGKNTRKAYAFSGGREGGRLLLFLKALGLISFREKKVRYNRDFFLLFDESFGKSRLIVLESNFRVYIYGDDRLNAYITSLFITRLKEFPDLIVGVITEESIRKTLALGITAQQILRYLDANALFEIDPNVQSQVLLWERKRKRVHSWRAHMFDNFLNFKDFSSTESFCVSKEIKHRAYKEKRVLVVDPQDYNRVKNYIKENLR